MNFPRSVAGQRTLRLLALTSALTLAACGGGGGDAPAEAPSNGLTTEITKATQLAVAADAGSTVASMDASTSLATMLSMTPPIISAGPGALDVSRKVVVVSPAALLRAVARKYAPTAPADTRLAAADAPVVETVDCTSGSGTITNTIIPSDGVSSSRVTLSLKNCATTLDSVPVVMDGTLSIQLDPVSEAPYALAFSMLATGYSVRGDGLASLMDGDMRILMGGDADMAVTTVSGKKLTVSRLGTLPSLAGSVEGPSELRTTTLTDYRQHVVMRADRASIESSALVETEVLGKPTTYELSTPKALVFAEGLFRSGRLQVVGAGGATLHIAANGDGTFKLERDDGGDGTIDDTVTSVDAEDLNLHEPTAPI